MPADVKLYITREAVRKFREVTGYGLERIQELARRHYGREVVVVDSADAVPPGDEEEIHVGGMLPWVPEARPVPCARCGKRTFVADATPPHRAVVCEACFYREHVLP